MDRQASLLVVDDEEFNRDMLARRLEGMGYAVKTAEDGPQALEMIERECFDLILLDHAMPRLSGLEVLKILRQQYPAARLPIIMVTALSESRNIVEALSLGANDYVTKPVDLAVAAARIRTHLLQKWAEEELRQSEERYALAARGANDGLWDWNLKTQTVHFSMRWKAMLGYEDGQIGSDIEEWFSRIHPGDIERVKRAFRIIAADGRPV